MEDYLAKKKYQNSFVAETYDYYHNVGVRGFLLNYFDNRGLSKALKNIQVGSTILDIPCGTGRITSMLLDKNHIVTGSDISSKMMEVCIDKLSKRSNFKGTFNCDVTDIPCENNSYDCVTSIRFFAHLPHDVRKKALSEVARVTRKYAIVEYSIYGHISQLRRNIENLSLKSKKNYSESAFVTRSELEEDSKNANLEIIGIYSKLPLLLDSFFVVFRKPKK